MNQPHPVDTLVGRKVRQMRKIRRMTQTQLADGIGCQFQQVQKYETGANRISASRLHEIARVLSYPIALFFEDADGFNSLPAADPLTIATISAMENLDEKQRHAILNLARQLAA